MIYATPSSRMINSHSFTYAAESLDNLHNTLPRMGRKKYGGSNEELTLYLDIMATQEKIVKVVTISYSFALF